jgi:hypothetical protein
VAAQLAASQEELSSVSKYMTSMTVWLMNMKLLVEWELAGKPKCQEETWPSVNLSTTKSHMTSITRASTDLENGSLPISPN